MEFVNKIIEIINQNPIISALSTLCSIFGAGIFALILSLHKARTNRKQIGRSNHRLREEIKKKDKIIRDYEGLIAQKNVELESFISLFPESQKGAHILFHELADAMNHGEEIKVHTAEFLAHHIESYEGQPMITNFLSLCGHLIVRRRLLETDLNCARAFVGNEKLTQYLLQFGSKYGYESSVLLGLRIDHDRVQADIEEIDFLEKIAKRKKDGVLMDKLLATRLFISTNAKVPLDDDMREGLFETALAKFNEEAGIKQDVSPTQDELARRFESFPNTSYLLASQLMRQGMTAEEAGMDSRIIFALKENANLHSAFRNALLAEAEGSETRDL